MGSNPIPLAILLIPIIIPATTHADAEAIIIYADGRLENLTSCDPIYCTPPSSEAQRKDYEKRVWDQLQREIGAESE